MIIRSLNGFIGGWDTFKSKCISGGALDHFWELSSDVLDRIEGAKYVQNKEKHNVYIKENPSVTRKKLINMSQGHNMLI